MMISVVTWDAGFRESFHTVDYFSRQDFDKDKYEFIWVEFYSSICPELKEKIEAMGNGRILCYEGKGEWHLGRCLNAAIKEAKGDLLVIPDGDIVVEEGFLSEVEQCHLEKTRLALYFRRWDQPKPESKLIPLNLNSLISECVLCNPTNYGGCLTLLKESFEIVSGYEEHALFSGAGASGMELYLRLKNAGLCVMWHPELKVYHPWHEGTLPNNSDYLAKLDVQNWVMKKRDLRVSYKSDLNEVENLIANYAASKPSLIKEGGLLAKIKNYFCH